MSGVLVVGLGVAVAAVTGVASAQEGGDPSDARAHTLAAYGSVGGARGAVGTGLGAHSGQVRIHTTNRSDGTFAMLDPSRGGLEVRNTGRKFFSSRLMGSASTDADNRWGSGKPGDPATDDVDAYYAAAQTWDYFLQKHGRRGIHDDGVGPLVFTDLGAGGEHSGQYEADCRCLLMGSAIAGGNTWNTIDVVAHEITHGITGATAALERSGESGGLNESTSDIFGTLVEFAANNRNDPPDYTIAEKVASKPVRYMDDPTKDGESKGCWEAGMDDIDPHAVGGISNKFFYQLAVGSGKSIWGDSPTCGGAPPVTGIGNDKVGRIWYRAVTRYMVANTNFAGARVATLRAAEELYGKDSAEQRSVAAAWTAVGVDGSGEVPPVPPGPRLRWINYPSHQLGEQVSFYVGAPDPQRQRVTYGATGLPPGVSIDAATGHVGGKPTQAGTYSVTITAADPDGNTHRRTIDWKVTAQDQPPATNAPTDAG